jgi:glycine cleavage system aminomethyltransferase T
VGVVAGAGEGAEEPLVAGMTLHAGDAPPGDQPAGDKVVGTVTSAAWSPEAGGWVALAYLHRSVDTPGDVRLRSGDGLGRSRAARVDAVPLAF